METQNSDITRRDFLSNTAITAGMLALPWLGLADVQAALEGGERRRVEAAIPSRAPSRPRKRRRLLIFELNVGYGGHRSIPTASLAFTLMGKKTGAFETVISRDPSVFEPESLRQFDAVFLNNTVGNLFTDPALRQSLLEFVYGGGGLMGVHGTSVAFTQWPGAREDWPEFGIMLGARGASHRDSDEHVIIKLDDPDHPVNRPFGGRSYDYRDEFFRIHGPYSRDRVRVIQSIDTEKTDMNQGTARGNCVRDDNDYAVAWVRQYGRGRVFYCTFAHNPYVFWDPKMLEFYLAATQFALGDLPGPTIPSNKLTPAIRAQERLDWRLGIEAYTFHKYTLFEVIDRTAQLGLPYMGGLSFQKVSKEIPKNFDPQLTDAESKQIRLKLDEAGVRMLTYYIHNIPGDEAGCRKVFEFGRRIGIETFMTEPSPEALDTIERFCEEYDINVALHNHDKNASPQYWHPEGIVKL
ncbi:MAG: ThuA domain-containing protein, partial [Planctomycetota bacterium]